MILIDNLKNGYAALWAKAKAYADGKVRDDQTNTTNTWSSQKIQNLVNDVSQELWEEGGWYKGETTVAGLDSLVFTTPSSTWYKPGTYTLTTFAATLGPFSVSGGSVLVYPVRTIDDVLGTVQVCSDTYGLQMYIRRHTPHNGWGEWTVFQAVESAESNTSLADYVNSLS